MYRRTITSRRNANLLVAISGQPLPITAGPLEKSKVTGGDTHSAPARGGCHFFVTVQPRDGETTRPRRSSIDQTIRSSVAVKVEPSIERARGGGRETNSG